ncbi:MAG: hypothetical protein EOM26_09795 [Alphaproteobacteria bacterium]|nr:hypothetical protein [Alphaproteobacteria bacterium]
MRKPASALATILFLLAMMLVVSPASAQEPSERADPIQQLELQTDALLQGLNEEELKYVYATRMRDGTLRAVRYIRGMVSGAVDACGAAQPDMKQALEERFAQWWETLGPLMAEAEENLDRTIADHSVPSPKAIRDHLTLVDKAAAFTRAKTERKYVTTRDACQYLLDNMDKTEEDLARKLQETLVSIPLPEKKKDTKEDNAPNHDTTGKANGEPL